MSVTSGSWGEIANGPGANESHNAGNESQAAPHTMAGEILGTHYRILGTVDTLFICLSFIYGFVVCGRLNFMLNLW